MKWALLLVALALAGCETYRPTPDQLAALPDKSLCQYRDQVGYSFTLVRDLRPGYDSDKTLNEKLVAANGEVARRGLDCTERVRVTTN